VRTRSDLHWLAFAIAAAIAAHFVATGGTPIDRQLPFVAVLLAACGWIACAPMVGMSIPLLLLAAMFLPDERTRLFAYGLIGAAAFAWAVVRGPKLALVVPGVMLLRWIPIENVVLWRELVVLGGALAVSGVRRPPRRSISGQSGGMAATLQIPIALAIALVTPAYPARLLLFPFLVAFLLWLPLPRFIWAIPFAIAAYYARYSIATLCVVAVIAFVAESVRIPIYAFAIALFAMWPWSGIVARAMPRFLFAEGASKNETPVWVALEAGRSVSIDAPPNAYRVVITASGANASRLPAGRAVGRVEVMGREGKVIRRELRIGDVADFGFTRREHFFASRNPIPRHTLDDIHGYGIAAWLHTAGRIAQVSLDGIATVRATAAPDLPPATKLQIEAVEFE